MIKKLVMKNLNDNIVNLKVATLDFLAVRMKETVLTLVIVLSLVKLIAIAWSASGV